jgi:hypothetical protein
MFQSVGASSLIDGMVTELHPALHPALWRCSHLQTTIAVLHYLEGRDELCLACCACLGMWRQVARVLLGPVAASYCQGRLLRLRGHNSPRLLW